MSNFLSPSWLWALIIPCALAVFHVLVSLRSAQRFTVRFSNSDLLNSVAPRRQGWRRHLVTALAVAALACLPVAAARPRQVQEVARKKATLMLAIDVSLSMGAEDVAPTRLEAAQKAASDYVASLPEGIDVGLIAFDGVASVKVPPTDDHRRVVSAIEDLELGEGTAIGEAVLAAVDAIQSEDTRTGNGSEPKEGQGRTDAAIIVLSDGKTTMGTDTLAAAPTAKEAGIPVSTIAYGTPDGTIVMPDGSTQPVQVEKQPLKDLAEATGGKAFSAASGQELAEVYSNLGRTVARDKRLVETGWRWSLAALVLLAAGATMSVWWFRRAL